MANLKKKNNLKDNTNINRNTSYTSITNSSITRYSIKDNYIYNHKDIFSLMKELNKIGKLKENQEYFEGIFEYDNISKYIFGNNGNNGNIILDLLESEFREKTEIELDTFQDEYEQDEQDDDDEQSSSLNNSKNKNDDDEEENEQTLENYQFVKIRKNKKLAEFNKKLTELIDEYLYCNNFIFISKIRKKINKENLASAKNLKIL